MQKQMTCFKLYFAFILDYKPNDNNKNHLYFTSFNNIERVIR
nr:ALPV-218 [Albatrosspox virus]